MSRADLLALQENVIHALGGDDAVAGINPARFDLVSALAKAKRISKIESVLPRTCRALGEDFRPLANGFVHAHPATSFRSRADALRFYQFLGRRRTPAYLLDLAYCELALSALVTGVEKEEPWSVCLAREGTIAIRRAPGVHLRRCKFDVRALFEGELPKISSEIPETRTHLAIVADPLVGNPRIAQLSPGVFEFLRALRVWRVLPEVTDKDTKELLDELQLRGLLEIARG
jgi:hypothetical protein